MNILSPPLEQQRFIPPNPIPGVSFRLAHSQDLQSLHENCYPETDRGQFEDHFRYLLKWQENGRCFILVAEENSHELTRISTNYFSNGAYEAGEDDTISNHLSIVGCGQLFFRAELAEIAELSVHPHYRNQGIGTALIDILTQIAQERKTTILEIGADIDNQAALRLYRRLGFGQDRHLTLPDNQNAIILNKYLCQLDHE